MMHDDFNPHDMDRTPPVAPGIPRQLGVLISRPVFDMYWAEAHHGDTFDRLAHRIMRERTFFRWWTWIFIACVAWQAIIIMVLLK